MAYTSAGLLALLKDTTQITTTNQGTSDAQLYQLLENAQLRIAQLMAVHVPHTNVSAPEALTSADSGATYTFAYYPMGHAELRDGRSGSLLVPCSDWNANGYVIEGQTVRLPNNHPRLFGNGLYARYVRTPSTLNASNEPTLMPTHARLAVVYDAAVEWAGQGGMIDPSPYLKMRQDFLWGDPAYPGNVGLIPALKTQYYGQGASAQVNDYWWRGQGYT
jgi:hypothetical protein